MFYELSPEIIQIYTSGNEKMKRVLEKYAKSLLVRYEAIKEEQELLLGIEGRDSKWQSQDDFTGIEDVLDEENLIDDLPN